MRNAQCAQIGQVRRTPCVDLPGPSRRGASPWRVLAHCGPAQPYPTSERATGNGQLPWVPDIAHLGTLPLVNPVVHRSPWRLIVLLVLAVPAILLAEDMLVSHRWVPAPATYDAVVGSTIDTNGSTVDVTQKYLTVDGLAQRRRDLGFGVALLAGGILAMGYSVVGLLRPRVVLRATEEGIAVHVDGRGHPARLFPWGDIVEVRSGVRDADGADMAVLSIQLAESADVPANPAGAVADPPWLHLWADDWDQPAHQVAPLLDPRTRRRSRTSRSS